MKNLVIVESPAKAKTLQRYLGKDYKILASYGHVRELIPKNGAVDVNDNFKMKYQVIDKNKKHLDQIIKEAKTADSIFLATDPDREGEAISWHLTELMKEKKVLKDLKPQRIEFHEITKNAILNAIENPRHLLMDLVEAQQARRALDYLVGFNLSPLLWRKIRRGLSAGRVQSPALRMICERENEIRAFVEKEYWTIHLDSVMSNIKFEAKLRTYNNETVQQFDITTEEEAFNYLKNIEGHDARVIKIETKPLSRKPTAPFTTSTLQQEAFRKLSFTTDRTMRVAQQLYEGVELGEGGITGLITYMRTDSVVLSKEAVQSIRDYILETKGPDYLPEKEPFYKNKSKNAQEAHEAIRPTNILNTPDKVKPFLTSDQFKLYSLIWKRTVASQMTNLIYLQTSADIEMGLGVFRATGRIIKFDGFLSVYMEDVDDEDKKDIDSEDSNDTKRLPPLKEGDIINVKNLFPTQHFTQPPARFSEASLVKSLEEYGIGRPSTYSSIISTLKLREYVKLESRRFIPTDTGEVVNEFLTEHFTKYVEYTFTADLENELDEIAEGKIEWHKVLSSFWNDFHKQVEEKASLTRQEAVGQDLDEICPVCKKHHLQVKFGRNGRFIACAGYPECTYTRSMTDTVEESLEKQGQQIVEGRKCPDCDSDLVYKYGKYGKFIGCSNYPKCKHIESLVKPNETGFECPVCKDGHIVERKSRYGKLFYSCSNYPKCTYAVWDHPVRKSCPQCSAPYMTIRGTKRKGVHLQCPNKECKYTEDYVGNWEELGITQELADKLTEDFPTPIKKLL